MDGGKTMSAYDWKTTVVILAVWGGIFTFGLILFVFAIGRDHFKEDDHG